jgi:hypothetical protein
MGRSMSWFRWEQVDHEALRGVGLTRPRSNVLTTHRAQPSELGLPFDHRQQVVSGNGVTVAVTRRCTTRCVG